MSLTESISKTSSMPSPRSPYESHPEEPPKGRARTANLMRAVAYIRVSDLSQVEGYSLDAQERLFIELCKSREWTPAHIYREEGRSARSDSIRKRPVFRLLLDDSGKGEFDVVVVHTLDRWARNQRVLLESMSTLGKNNVALASITENIDYSTPQGKLFLQMLSGFAEYFSDSLATHVSKGLSQRTISGKHTGGLPFGYQSCWDNREGERKRRCDPEHPGEVHLVPQEAEAVEVLFSRYATGTTTLSQLAYWLNDNGFRTKNTKKLPDGNGDLVSGPRLFTTASVRGILHNVFYTGLVRHKDDTFQGAHESIIATEIFETVETALRKNSGRSNTLKARPGQAGPGIPAQRDSPMRVLLDANVVTDLQEWPEILPGAQSLSEHS